ncbi:unnamed protein product [Fraxinus pennsylvanica]|uniref:Rx N-terminal domain-containing protein n=1 Tax=Fraxinus pennsylvanica TaxID=56036 RepID=A0AAD1ZEA7_9LAMI|nr:unnamed protein product [Fraxinus pennsylvanica]
MAELSVTGALVSVEMVISLLSQRLNLKKHIIVEVESIKSWLETLQAFITNHDEDHADHSKWLARHVENVRKIARQIVDVLEEFELHTQHPSRRNELAQKASEFFHYRPLNDIFEKIKCIKRKIDDFVQQNQIIKEFNASGSGMRTRVTVNPLNFDDPDVNNMLSSVYKDLPRDIKSCFLYFSIFPEGYDVDCGRLMRLWVAEKFANEKDGKTAEEVAEEILNELILWNLVEVSTCYSDGHPPRHCRVHNLVLKFIFKKCEDENFISIISNQNSPKQKLRRHLSVQSDCTCSSVNIQEAAGRFKNLFIREQSRACRCCSRDRDFSDVRSLFVFGSNNNSGNSFQDFKLLRVVDLEGSLLTEFPKQIDKFTLIRYLSLRDTKIKAINPKSIKKLCCLETLDLKQTNVTELPKKVWRLKKLRHLLAGRKTVNNFADSDSVQGGKVFKGIENLTNLQKLSFEKTVRNFADFDSVHGVKVFEGVQNLTNLQTLSRVDAGQNGRIIQELKHLSQLKKLGLTGLKKEFGGDLCASIKKMEHLTTLDVCTATKSDYLELGDLVAGPPLSLQRLYLKGRLEKFPEWISSLSNLFCLRLKCSRLKNSPLNSLKNLPNLVELHLVDCFMGEGLTFETSSFKQIKMLVIEQFSELNTIKFEEGVMPGLQQISLSRCPKLKMPPLGINKLSKVECLTLYDMNQDFIASIKRVGEERAMVEHIRVIHSFTLNGQSWSVENLSHSSTIAAEERASLGLTNNTQRLPPTKGLHGWRSPPLFTGGFSVPDRLRSSLCSDLGLLRVLSSVVSGRGLHG